MKETCFVIMPFREPLNEYYSEIIKPAIHKSGLFPVRADEIYGTQSIIKDIVEKIFESKLLIADLTYRNPNVMYELGVAHSLNKPVIMLVQSTDDIPFDLKHLRTIVYETTKVRWHEKLQESIENTITAVLDKPEDSKAFDLKLRTELGPSLKKMLARTTQDFKIKLSTTEEIFVDEKGNCELKKKRNITALSDITHQLFETYIDKPGKVKVSRAFDEQLKKDIEVVSYEETESSHSFFIIFDDIKRKGTIFNYSITLNAENYLSDIVDKGIGFRRIFGFFQTRIEGIREKYYFPNSRIYENLKVTIYKHPISDMVGREIIPYINHEYKIYEINHDNLIDHTPEIEIKFEITSHNILYIP